MSESEEIQCTILFNKFFTAQFTLVVVEISYSFSSEILDKTSLGLSSYTVHSVSSTGIHANIIFKRIVLHVRFFLAKNSSHLDENSEKYGYELRNVT